MTTTVVIHGSALTTPAAARDVEPEKGETEDEYNWCLEYEVNIPYDVEPELPMTEPEDCGRVTVRPA